MKKPSRSFRMELRIELAVYLPFRQVLYLHYSPQNNNSGTYSSQTRTRQYGFGVLKNIAGVKIVNILCISLLCCLVYLRSYQGASPCSSRARPRAFVHLWPSCHKAPPHAAWPGQRHSCSELALNTVCPVAKGRKNEAVNRGVIGL